MCRAPSRRRSSPSTWDAGHPSPIGTNPHFMPVENPAPPRPRRFAAFTSSCTSWGVICRNGFAHGLIAASLLVCRQIQRLAIGADVLGQWLFQSVAFMFVSVTCSNGYRCENSVDLVRVEIRRGNPRRSSSPVPGHRPPGRPSAAA